MFGWLREEIARASRRNRSRRAGLASSAAVILKAPTRSRRGSRERYTAPMPPAPSGPRISYGPKRVPGGTGIDDGGIIVRRHRRLLFGDVPSGSRIQLGMKLVLLRGVLGVDGDFV